MAADGAGIKAVFDDLVHTAGMKAMATRGDLNAGKQAEILQTDGAFGVLDEVRGMEDRGSDGIKGLGGYEIRDLENDGAKELLEGASRLSIPHRVHHHGPRDCDCNLNIIVLNRHFFIYYFFL